MNRIDVSKIFGRIRLVKRFPDFKVQIVKGPADLEVELVDEALSVPGKWQIVRSNFDYRIMLVKGSPDFTVSSKDSIKPPRH